MGKTLNKLLVRSGKALIVWSKEQALAADRFSIGLNIDAKLLMENAGRAVFEEVVREASSKKSRILIFAGSGNNGADAVVAARHLLAKNLKCTLFMVCPKTSWNEALNYQLSLLEGINQQINGALRIKYIAEDFKIVGSQKRTIVVDGILGAGLTRPPEGCVRLAITALNEYKINHPKNCHVISVDIPSGLSLEAVLPMGEHVLADTTVTFGPLKRAHISEPTRALCGNSKSFDIGLFSNSKPHNFFIAKQKTLNELFLPRPKNSYKGVYGHILILEGGNQYLGASRLSALAALRAGGGLVTLATNKQSDLSLDHAEFMHCPFEKISDCLLNKIDAVVVGPGLSKEELHQERGLKLLNMLAEQTRLLVVDADGLKLFRNPGLYMKKIPIVATPHAGEAAGLLECNVQDIEKDRFFALEKLAAIKWTTPLDIIWVLKGATTLVRSTKGDVFAFHGDLPVLSASGSGDILSGVIAGLAKQTPSPLFACLLAISLQIEAGKLLSKSIFKGSLASELADVFPMLTKR